MHCIQHNHWPYLQEFRSTELLRTVKFSKNPTWWCTCDMRVALTFLTGTDAFLLLASSYISSVGLTYHCFFSYFCVRSSATWPSSAQSDWLWTGDSCLPSHTFLQNYDPTTIVMKSSYRNNNIKSELIIIITTTLHDAFYTIWQNLYPVSILIWQLTSATVNIS